MQYPCTLKSKIYHSNKRVPSPFFSFGYQSCTWPLLIHSVDKTHVLVVTVELIWLLFLNILSFNFVSTPNKFLRLKRLRKSYVNRPDVALTNHTSHKLLDVQTAAKKERDHIEQCSTVQCGHAPFLQLFVPNSTNTSSKNNLRSLRRVTISSSVQH